MFTELNDLPEENWDAAISSEIWSRKLDIYIYICSGGSFDMLTTYY